MYQLSSHYSVNESSSLFTITIPTLSESEEFVIVRCANNAQENFVRQNLANESWLVREASYNKELNETTPTGDWFEVKSEAFRFFDRNGQEIRAASTASILNRFRVSAAPKSRSRRAA